MTCRNNCLETSRFWAGILRRYSTEAARAAPSVLPCKGAESWRWWQKVKATAGVEDSHERYDPCVMPCLMQSSRHTMYVRLQLAKSFCNNVSAARHRMPTRHTTVMWSYCPKDRFCGAGTVEITANLAVLQFNNGANAVGCSVGFYA